MDWWNDLTTWLTAPDTRPILFTAAVIVLAIIVSGLVSASIAKAAVRRLVDQREREQKAVAIAAFIDAATEASVWNSLTPGEQVLADRAVGQADIHVRLLPLKSAPLAADWAAHQLAEMKRNSATFGYELAPALSEFRDRLVDWQNRPSKAKRLFQNDIERWSFAADDSERELVRRQDGWVAEQHQKTHAAATPAAPEPVVETDQATSTNRPTSAERAFPEPRTDTQTQKLIEDVAAIDQRIAATNKPRPSEERSA
jgi:F0F1-type ATP synthase membrane subunit c/vacuolar-type H+-ATPase subunit K